MAVVLYGIPNCDTVKKARTWLAGRGIECAFHDYKKTGPDPTRIADWIAQAGLDRVLNRAGTTFRKLPESAKKNLDEAAAIALMVEHPATIKRPIVEHDGGLLVGFRPAEWAAVF